MRFGMRAVSAFRNLFSFSGKEASYFTASFLARSQLFAE
jgi:hypothetical protein